MIDHLSKILIVNGCFLFSDSGNDPTDQWLQFEFPAARHVVSIRTRGRVDSPQYTREYQIHYWDSSVNLWKTVKDESDNVKVMKLKLNM